MEENDGRGCGGVLGGWKEVEAVTVARSVHEIQLGGKGLSRAVGALYEIGVGVVALRASHSMAELIVDFLLGLVALVDHAAIEQEAGHESSLFIVFGVSFAMCSVQMGMASALCELMPRIFESTKRFFEVGFILSLLVGLTGCGGESPESGEQPANTVQIQADWYAQPEHAGFYLAEVKGYYQAEGIDLEVRAGGPNDNTRQKVAQGEVSFGVARMEDVIMAIDRGLPVIAVGAYLQRIPLSFMVHADQPVYSVTDIGDRPVMATSGSLYLQRLEARHGISLSTIPHMRTIARFLSDKELVQQCYLTNEPYFVKKAGVDVRVLPMFEAGVDSFRVLYASNSLVEERGGLVEKVVTLSHRGWADYISEGGGFELAHAAIKEMNPEQEMEFMAWAREQIIQRGIATGAVGEVPALRSITRERVQEMADELLDLGLVKRRYLANELVAWKVVDSVLSKPIPGY